MKPLVVRASLSMTEVIYFLSRSDLVLFNVYSTNDDVERIKSSYLLSLSYRYILYGMSCLSLALPLRFQKERRDCSF
jgi:hypothetical protein